MGYAFVDRRCSLCKGTGTLPLLGNKKCTMCNGTGLIGSFEEVPDIPMNGDKEFGDRLRKIREQRKCGFTELANLLKCKVSHISQIECGIITPTDEERVKLEEWMKDKVQDNLTAEQWQAIAEKLAEYLEIQCSILPYYDGKEADDFIEQAKKELGYE